MKPLPRATGLAHELIAARLSPGDHAIDATAGNGHDTKFLAQTVGADGSVRAIDLQKEAIDATRRLCAGIDCRIEYEIADHASLSGEPRSAAAIMFNLGYLPSGDKTVVTQPGSTITALGAALELLAKGGILTVAVYTGHPGGAEEGEAVGEFAASLEQDEFSVAKYEFLNQRNTPPHLIVVQRR